MHPGLHVGPVPRPNKRQPTEAIADRDHCVDVPAGNAVQFTFMPVNYTSPGPMIRRQVLTKLVTNPGQDGQIWDAVIGGRSPSPFSDTMGAHSTAWVAHLDAIRRHVVNLSAVEGAKYLVDLANDAAQEKTSPLLTLQDSMPAGQKVLMTGAKASMKLQARQLKRLADDDTTTAAAMIAAIRALIGGYLQYVNYLPTATVRGGDPSGHGEGVARGLLNQFEYVCALTKRKTALSLAGDQPNNQPAQDEREGGFLTTALEQIKKGTFGKLLITASADNFDAVRNPALRTEMVHSLWAMFAAETPDVYAKQSGADTVKVWTAALKNFLHTVRLGYPYGYDFVAMNTPAAQWEGLQWAIGEAHVILSDDVRTKLGEAITGKAATWGKAEVPALDAKESEIRGLDQYAEVAQSDLFGGGAGFTVTVLMDGPRVGSVEMTGRTQTPFSKSMGAHTTAWTAVEDALRARLVAKDLPTAIAALRDVATNALTDKRLDLTHLVDEKQQHHLAGAYTRLDNVLKDTTALLSEQTMIGFLETLTNVYLSYSNLLPLSTVESGGVPGGRSEGRARTFLLAFEAKGKSEIPAGVNEIAYVTDRLDDLFDPGGLTMFPPELGDFREDLDLGGHPLEGKFAASDDAPSAEEIAGIAVTEFYETVSLAYPNAVKFIGWVLDPADPQLPVAPMDTGATARVAPTGVTRKRPRSASTVDPAADPKKQKAAPTKGKAAAPRGRPARKVKK